MSENSSKGKPDVCSAILLEALKQNCESARYFESSRWKYTYAYYVAFGVSMVYVFKYFLSGTGSAIDFESGTIDPVQCLFLFFLSGLLVFGGIASFVHLLHSNISYKNHIRAIQWISEHLKLNKGISEYIHAKEKGIADDDKRVKEIDRYTYMALPLPFSIRKVSFKSITILLLLISSLASFWFLVLVGLHYVYPDWPTELQLSVRLCWFFLISFMLSAVVYPCLDNYWVKKENDAKEELNKRKPPFLGITDEPGH